MITIAGSALTAVVDPARGAKITSLRDGAGVEWLAQPAPTSDEARGQGFLEAEMAGWDECAPTIVACSVDGHDLPDHGDLWNTAFDEDADGGLTAIGASLGYRFRRSIHPTRDGIRLEYEAAALSRPMPFLWAAHPQFVAPPGTRVELVGDGAGAMRVIDVLDPALPEIAWSSELASIDAVRIGAFRKVYAHPDAPVHVARLIRPGGGSLTLRWSAECPYVGIWFDAAAFSREPVIAIEPATAYFDALQAAIQLGRAPVISPQQPLRWWVEVAVDPSF